MKNRLLKMLAAVALICLLPALALAADFATVQGGTLNLRQSPDANSRSLGKYQTGAWVQVDHAAGGNWVAVRTMDGKTGYMLSVYLNFEQGGSGGSTAEVRYAQGGYVNLRKGPSLDYAIIQRVTSGTIITVVDDSYEWNYVCVNGVYGYIHDSLLNKGAGSSATIVTKNGGKVNVRKGPSSNYGGIGSLPTGTKVTVLKKGAGWYKISANGLVGFMATQYLSTGSGGSSTPTTRTAWVANPKSTQVLNLREYASQSARSIGAYRNGTQVKVVNYGSTWCEVYVGTRHGYMMTKYLSFSYTQPVTPEPYIPPYVEPTAYPVYPTPTPYVAPTSYVEVITPNPIANPSAGTKGTLAIAAGSGSAIINVYNDSTMTQFKAAYASGTPITILQYSKDVTMVLVDGSVGYVSTWNVNW